MLRYFDEWYVQGFQDSWWQNELVVVSINKDYCMGKKGKSTAVTFT